jgi:uncharacterized membrane protein
MSRRSARLRAIVVYLTALVLYFVVFKATTNTAVRLIVDVILIVVVVIVSVSQYRGLLRAAEEERERNSKL